MFAWKPPESKIGVLNISAGIYVVVVGVIVFLCGYNASQKSADFNGVRSNTCIISKNKNNQTFKKHKKKTNLHFGIKC